MDKPKEEAKPVQEEAKPATSEPQQTVTPTSAKPAQKSSRTLNQQMLAEAKNTSSEPETAQTHSEGIPKADANDEDDEDDANDECDE